MSFEDEFHFLYVINKVLTYLLTYLLILGTVVKTC